MKQVLAEREAAPHIPVLSRHLHIRVHWDSEPANWTILGFESGRKLTSKKQEVKRVVAGNGGERGIRTLGSREGSLDFESSPFGQLRHLSESP